MHDFPLAGREREGRFPLRHHDETPVYLKQKKIKIKQDENMNGYYMSYVNKGEMYTRMKQLNVRNQGEDRHKLTKYTHLISANSSNITYGIHTPWKCRIEVWVHK